MHIACSKTLWVRGERHHYPCSWASCVLFVGVEHEMRWSGCARRREHANSQIKTGTDDQLASLRTNIFAGWDMKEVGASTAASAGAGSGAGLGAGSGAGSSAGTVVPRRVPQISATVQKYRTHRWYAMI